jgi:hypothetical protein
MKRFPRRRNNSQRARSLSVSAQTLTAEQQTVGLLKEIRDLQKTQINASPPQEPDMAPLRIRRSKLFTVVKSYQAGTINTAPLVDQSGALQFNLASVATNTEITSLFDQYRIVQISLDFVPLLHTLSTPPLYTVIDYDDATVPTALSTMYDYSSLQTSQSGQQQTRVFTPRVAIAAYSGVFTSFANQSMQWIDAASTTVQHYGVKWYFPALAGLPTSLAYTIVAHLTINVRAIH